MKLQNVVVRYGKREALTIDALSFERGTVYAVLGSNGCGKSTLAKVLSGLLTPQEGSCSSSPDELVGYMPQRSYAFYGSVLKNVQLGAARGSDTGEWIEHVMKKLDLARMASEKGKSLSGGETARMALARVLVGNHTFLVLDEPTASLDVESTLAAEQLIQEYREIHNATVVLITHSLSQARRMSDIAIFMKSGRIVEMGESSTMLQVPQTPELKSFIEVLGN